MWWFMKRYLVVLFLIFGFSSIYAGFEKGPNDFLGRVHIPGGIEIESMKFMDETTVYAATNGDGIYVSYDQGTTWGKIKSYPEEGNYMEDMIIPEDGVIYTASMGGGIFKSSDNGTSWEVLNNGLTNLKVQAIEKTDWGLLLAGTYGSGIFISEDDGKNWVRSDNGFRYDNITDIETLSNGFIVAATMGGGFYSSRDSAVTWRRASANLPNPFINDLVLDNLKTKIYAATNGNGVWATANGVSWFGYENKYHPKYAGENEFLPDSAVASIAFANQNLYMGTRSTGIYSWDPDIWKSWIPSGSNAMGISAMAANNDGAVLAARSYGEIVRTENDGEDWEVVSNAITMPDSIHTFGSPNLSKVYASKFGKSLISVYTPPKTFNNKIYRSDDRGYSWRALAEFTPDVNGFEVINDICITPDSVVVIATNNKVLVSKDYGKTYPITFQVNEPDSVTNYENVFYDLEDKSISFIYQMIEIVENMDSPPTVVRKSSSVFKSFNNGDTWSENKFDDQFRTNHYIDYSSGNWYINNGNNIYCSTDKGASYSDYAALPKNVRAFYNINGSIYTLTMVPKSPTEPQGYFREIAYSTNYGKNFIPVPFDPSGYLPDNAVDWRIGSLQEDYFGGIYIDVIFQQAGVGFKHALFYKERGTTDWQDITHCYNMDRIKQFEFDLDGYAYIVTNALYKRLAPNKLKAPKIIFPEFAEKGVNSNPVLGWNTAEFAEEYELQVAPTELFNSTFETNVTGDTVCKIVLDLPANTQYWWRLRSKTHETRSEWVKSKFTTGIAPVKLISPENDAVGVPLYADLEWEKHPNADYYSVKVATDELFQNIIFEEDSTLETSITTGMLQGLTTYFWTVRGRVNNGNDGQWAEPWEFKTIMGPPVLISPADQTIDIPLETTLIWDAVEIATSYHLQVATDAEFTTIFHEGEVDTTAFTLSGLTPETEYFWRVASVNDEGQSAYSIPWSFTTLLPAVVLISPENETVNFDWNLPLTWEDHASSNKYQIQIATDAAFTKESIIDDMAVNEKTEFISTKLNVYKEYFWRVRILLEDERTGLWSETWKFKTGIETTILKSPADESKDVKFLNQNFTWHKVEGATHYQLQIALDEEFNQLIFSRDSIEKTGWKVDEILPKTVHYWRVQAWNAESKLSPKWSETWSCTTEGVTIELRLPYDKSKDVAIPALIRWVSSPSELDNFHLQIAEDENFENIVLEREHLENNEFMLNEAECPKLTDYGTYYWRVRSVIKTYESEFTEPWSFTISTVGVHDIAKGISIYPQPADNFVNIGIEGLTTNINGWYISDLDGNMVLSESILLAKGTHNLKINTNTLSNGKYFLVLETEKGRFIHEIMIVK